MVNGMFTSSVSLTQRPILVNWFDFHLLFVYDLLSLMQGDSDVKRMNQTDAATYHVTSRVLDETHRMDDIDIERFRSLMRRVEMFSGVKILTYALMPDHFHILMRMPGPKELTEEEVIDRCLILYGSADTDKIVRTWQLKREAGRGELVQRQLDAIRERMHDVSAFMKMRKMRYTLIYNAIHGRTDPLWASRYTCVLVEDREAALAAMAAYIDLNPVRARVVTDPKDYRFSGYGEASAGNRKAIDGLAGLLARRSDGMNPAKTLARYRLYLNPDDRTSDPTSASPNVLTIPERQAIESVLRDGGTINLATALRCRIPAFTKGKVFGSQAFVDDIMARNNAKVGKRTRAFHNVLPGDLQVGCIVRGQILIPPKAE